MDIKGWIVDNEADGFGRPVTIKPLRPRNVFLMDETGNNTHGKDDCKRGGEQMVVPCGEIPKEEVGVNNSHYTLAPFTDLNGDLRFLVVIFAAAKVRPCWAMGVDVFAE